MWYDFDSEENVLKVEYGLLLGDQNFDEQGGWSFKDMRRIEYLISNKFLDLCLSHSFYPKKRVYVREKLSKNNDENIIYPSNIIPDFLEVELI